MEVNQALSEEAIKYIKDHQKEVINRFANPDNFPPSDTPFSIFMAGSPGAGKTELSKAFAVTLKKQGLFAPVRIDADEIREIIPQFKGNNSCDVQGAAALGVEKLFDFAQKHNQNLILDATFADYTISKKNVNRALKRGRSVSIIYLYQDPIVAWEFTRKREMLEHRNVPKSVFIEAFINAKENVNKVKSELGDKVELTFVIRDFTEGSNKMHFNVENVDHYIKNTYNHETLNKILPEVLVC